MLSAISFGVFWRSAPSTSAIIRSRNVSPGFGGDAHPDPVRQHPRAAGHGRAVAAGLADDRRRLARDRGLVDRRDAFDDLAVAGDELAGRHEHDVAPAAARRRHRLRLAVRPARRLAMVSVRARRSVAACALPRPSAIASAKFANSTVNQSQAVICSSKPRPCRPAAACRRSSRVVIALAHLDDEHDRVPHHDARIELLHRRQQRLPDDGRVPDRAGR